MTEIATTFVAHVQASGRMINLVISLDTIEAETWGYYESVPWMKISGYISDRTVAEHRTVEGELVIVNWAVVPLVTYENPWLGIHRDKRGNTMKRSQQPSSVSLENSKYASMDGYSQ